MCVRVCAGVYECGEAMRSGAPPMSYANGDVMTAFAVRRERCSPTARREHFSVNAWRGVFAQEQRAPDLVPDRLRRLAECNCGSGVAWASVPEAW